MNINMLHLHTCYQVQYGLIHSQDRQMLPLWVALWRSQDSIGCDENGETVLLVL